MGFVVCVCVFVVLGEFVVSSCSCVGFSVLWWLCVFLWEFVVSVSMFLPGFRIFYDM